MPEAVKFLQAGRRAANSLPKPKNSMYAKTQRPTDKTNLKIQHPAP